MHRPKPNPLSFPRMRRVKLFVCWITASFIVLGLSLQVRATENLALPQGLQGFVGNIFQFEPVEPSQEEQGSQGAGSSLHPPPLKEEEPNDTLEEAQELVFGRDLEGSLKDDDRDIFRFSLDSPEQVAITLAFPKGSSGAALWLSVLDSNGEVLLTPRAVFPDFERVSVVYFLYPGTYYVQIGPMPYHGEGYTSPPYAVYIDIRE